MIKPSELRLGNKIKVFDEIVEVTDISDDNIGTTAYFHPVQMFGTCDCTPEMAAPIELTPEILERCGFVKSIENNFIFGDFRVWIEPQYKRVFVFCNRKVLDDEISLRIEKKYLHQLQNLVFDLTGEELTIEQTVG